VADALPPIIIKRKKAGGHGHHGGAWKVAYADFVTAMMAFFLLLWLLNVTTEEQKNGIADYFTPTTASNSTESGSGNVLGGATITVDGSSVSPSSPISIADPIPTTGTNMEESENESQGSPFDNENEGNNNHQQDHTADPNPNTAMQAGTRENTQQNPNIKPTEDAIDKAIQEREQAAFDKVAEELRQAIQNIPELSQLSKSLIIDQTPEGLRIQLVDQEGYSMFPRGSAVMADRTKQLIDLVAKAVSSLPNKLSLSGHTDSTPYLSNNGYSNWELSSDRANAARRELAKSGIDIERILTVVGRADRDPFIKDDPADPRNRRLSIVLIRQAAAPAGIPAQENSTAPQQDNLPAGTPAAPH